jgi:predicted membrane chloride channel (bestrophin family)
MARTIVFLYVFTVPFVLLSDESGLAAHCFMVFILTFGFVGLACVAIEIDNPFGDDPNDFDHNAMATMTYEDIYLAILDVDGPEWTDKLRARMQNETHSVTQDATTELSWLDD